MGTPQFLTGGPAIFPEVGGVKFCPKRGGKTMILQIRGGSAKNVYHTHTLTKTACFDAFLCCSVNMKWL